MRSIISVRAIARVLGLPPRLRPRKDAAPASGQDTAAGTQDAPPDGPDDMLPDDEDDSEDGEESEEETLDTGPDPEEVARRMGGAHGDEAAEVEQVSAGDARDAAAGDGHIHDLVDVIGGVDDVTAFE